MTRLGRLSSFASTLAVVMLAGWPGQTLAGEAVVIVPSAANGLKFAETFCKNCHVVEGEANNPVTAGIPSLRGIANRPGQTGANIQRVLINPHPPMPDMKLSNQEIQDILAYLETLRADKSAPPLLPPVEPSPKQKYPSPS